jgi:hypothetical protein
MGFDLLSEYGDTSFNDAGWASVLNLAIEYGWEPIGTAPPDDWPIVEPGDNMSWSGEYFSNSFQEVTESDARTLGEALIRAVAQERKSPTKWPQDWSHVSKFADLALKGGFIIA